ncbi:MULTISPECIES: hypothetical protein [unclassified Methylobacterium]|uniref:hypothetical protein n=1 Tax=unclassified Methylobacterium TaxID=2615210 RepID=UPI0011C1F37C|nr:MULTISPECIES: hypothetical protein [unclassified Methylobacterium]QEE37610.1 hypothetical protein FVA80_00210 [Methylobacterium sp. WL1]TXN52339.1 hypothetical protein FV241_29670 [Methylobacterium sp. WL2]
MNARLQKLESAIRPLRHRKVRQFAIEGPKGLPPGAAEAFLRECGHDLKDEDHNIVRIMVAADRDLPLKDITTECYR